MWWLALNLKGSGRGINHKGVEKLTTKGTRITKVFEFMACEVYLTASGVEELTTRDTRGEINHKGHKDHKGIGVYGLCSLLNYKGVEELTTKAQGARRHVSFVACEVE
jgi:hypothetical protein